MDLELESSNRGSRELGWPYSTPSSANPSGIKDTVYSDRHRERDGDRESERKREKREGFPDTSLVSKAQGEMKSRMKAEIDLGTDENNGNKNRGRMIFSRRVSQQQQQHQQEEEEVQSTQGVGLMRVICHSMSWHLLNSLLVVSYSLVLASVECVLAFNSTDLESEPRP